MLTHNDQPARVSPEFRRVAELYIRTLDADDAREWIRGALRGDNLDPQVAAEFARQADRIAGLQEYMARRVAELTPTTCRIREAMQREKDRSRATQ